MVNLLIHENYYRYREKRKQIKQNLVDIGDYQTAKSELEAAITEHKTKYPNIMDEGEEEDFNFGERLIMDHALEHLDVITEKGDLEYYVVNEGDGTRTKKHQNDLVKSILVQVPPPTYIG